MADINVERRAPSAWAWIIGLIILALLIWILVEIFGDGRERTERRFGTVDTTFVEPATAPLPAAPVPEPVTTPMADTGVSTLGTTPGAATGAGTATTPGAAPATTGTTSGTMPTTTGAPGSSSTLDSAGIPR